MLLRYQSSILANYLPYTPYTDQLMAELAGLHPKMFATMHGSAFNSDDESALNELARIIRETYGNANTQPHQKQ